MSIFNRTLPNFITSPSLIFLNIIKINYFFYLLLGLQVVKQTIAYLNIIYLEILIYLNLKDLKLYSSRL